MQLQDKYRIALLAAYAVVIHSFEGFLPTPVPWLRFGIANIIVLVALVLYGFKPAMMVTLIKVILSSLLTGTFLGPSFIMGIGGSVCSVAAMGAVFYAVPRVFGAVGLSLIAAFFHNLAQLALAYILFVQKIEPVLMITPILILIGTITGFVNGIVAGILIKNMKNCLNARN